MTDAHLDLLKVILDKGLLAIILLALGFLFSRKLEHYRATSAYFNKLAERRIEAYDRILRGLGEARLALQTIMFIAEHGRTKLQQSGSYDLEALAKEVHQQFEKMQDQITKQHDWSVDLIYVSEDLTQKINALLEDQKMFLDHFFQKSSESHTGDPLLDIQKAFDSLTKSWVELQGQARDEIADGIFAKHWKANHG